LQSVNQKQEKEMALLNGLGQAATIAQLSGLDAFGLTSMIMQAVHTVRRN